LGNGWSWTVPVYVLNNWEVALVEGWSNQQLQNAQVDPIWDGVGWPDLNAQQPPQPPPNVDQIQIQAPSESSSYEEDSSSAQSATSQGQNQESILGREDLELFQPENLGLQPAWLGPFKSGGWWLADPSSCNNSCILLSNLSWP
jgi:hypothetical protein